MRERIYTTTETVSKRSHSASSSSVTGNSADQTKEQWQTDPASQTVAAPISLGNNDNTSFDKLFEILQENSGLSDLSSDGPYNMNSERAQSWESW
jgi:hypothetical protein